MLINRRQQSTAGWNIWTTLLDVTGGALSISQLLLDATLTHDVGKVQHRVLAPASRAIMSRRACQPALLSRLWHGM